jgi:hypothetical protein
MSVLIWFRLNTGAWLPSGDPALGTGGISLAALAGQTFYATVQGTGDAGITLNAGQSPFVGSVPAGYTSGLPHSGGGFTTLDPSKRFGSATLSAGNTKGNFPASPGMVQSVDGYSTGQYYFELASPTTDIFSADWGGGMGKNYTAGGDMNSWFSFGAFNITDLNGGAVVGGQTLVNNISAIGALGVDVVPNAFNFAGNSGFVVGVAISLSIPVTNATMADLLFTSTSGFVDFSQPAERRKFIYVNGGAQNLNPDGSAPFAVTPPVFLSLEGSGTPNSFAQNKGRGGNFVVGGSNLVAGSTNPPPVTTSEVSVATTVPFSAVLGDRWSGNIYAFSPEALTDNGAQRKWVRRWRALPSDTNSATSFGYLTIDMEMGAGVPPGTSPQVVLRWSDDGGKTWSGNRIVPVGPTGRTKFRVKFNRLGSTQRFNSSTRIFELSSTDPFKVSLISAAVMTK